jgi:carbamoyltransferase
MTMTFTVREDKRSIIPAVTPSTAPACADGQRVRQPRYYRLIKRFAELTGVPVVLNTSLNVKGDPVAMSRRTPSPPSSRPAWTTWRSGDFVVTKR